MDKVAYGAGIAVGTVFGFIFAVILNVQAEKDKVSQIILKQDQDELRQNTFDAYDNCRYLDALQTRLNKKYNEIAKGQQAPQFVLPAENCKKALLQDRFAPVPG